MSFNLFRPKKVKVIEKIFYKEVEPRADWFVYDAGQDPLHCLWYCTLCSFTLKDKDGYSISVSVEECKTFSEAIEEANKLAQEKELIWKKQDLF